MEEFFTRPLCHAYPVIMVDCLVLGKMTILVAMGITSDGEKQILGILAGDLENAIVVTDLFTDLIA